MLRYKVYENEVEVKDYDTHLKAIGYVNGRVDQILDDYADETSEEYGVPQLFHVQREHNGGHDRVEIIFNVPRLSVVLEIEEYQVEDELTRARW